MHTDVEVRAHATSRDDRSRETRIPASKRHNIDVVLEDASDHCSKLLNEPLSLDDLHNLVTRIRNDVDTVRNILKNA